MVLPWAVLLGMNVGSHTHPGLEIMGALLGDPRPASCACVPAWSYVPGGHGAQEMYNGIRVGRESARTSPEEETGEKAWGSLS